MPNPLPVLIAGLLLPVARTPSYDPLTTHGRVTVTDAQFDYGEEKRTVPVRIYLPERTTPAPVLLFSHGLGGSRNNNGYLGNHWAGRGYVVVALQHAGSDEAVWRSARAERLAKMRSAANARTALARFRDVPATLDQLARWNAVGGELAGRLDLTRVGMSGHSYGAVTTQAVSGQNYGRRGQLHTDKRIRAAVAFSPSVPGFGANADTFAKVTIPWLLMTGTKDSSVIGRTTPAARRRVYQQLPGNGRAYELVLEGAQHMAFSDRTLIGTEHRNPNHHRAIRALSTAFWDTWLLGLPEARAWLHSESPRQLLRTGDIWQRK